MGDDSFMSYKSRYGAGSGGHMIEGQHLPFVVIPQCLIFVMLGFNSEQKDRVPNQFHRTHASEAVCVQGVCGRYQIPPG